MIRAHISEIDYYLPEKVLSNEELSELFPEWSPAAIHKKTGICSRHIAARDETSLDLAEKAVRNLFESEKIRPGEIDFIILCTQTPDYIVPTSACLLQDRLGVPVSAGALDVNLGCSGFVYGLALAKGLIEGGTCRTALVVTAETYSKLLHPADKSVRVLFGDGAAATLLRGLEDDGPPLLGPFVFGTDGSGASNLMVKAGGMRFPRQPSGQEAADAERSAFLRMNGPAIFSFTLQMVPRAIGTLLEKSGCALGDIDHFIFHQANRFMLDALRNAGGIDGSKFIIDLQEYGNTVSSTIPIALCNARRKGGVKSGERVMLVGFGVGLSWAAALARIP